MTQVKVLCQITKSSSIFQRCVVGNGSRLCCYQKRAIEDPGTAGDRGEESWAEFIRGWVPERHAVVTKGRILFSNDEMSQQMDLLILNADYPKRLRNKRVFLASGVLAAFECKLTLRASHVKEAFERSENLKKLEIPQEGKLRRELCHRILYGLLAHSSEWKSKKRGERGERLLTALDCGLFKASHPRDLPEVICVADTATARLSKYMSLRRLHH